MKTGDEGYRCVYCVPWKRTPYGDHKYITKGLSDEAQIKELEMTDVAESHKGLSWLCCFMSAWVAEPTVLTWSALGVPVVLGRGCFFPCMKGLSEFGLSVGPAIALEKPRLGTSLGLQWLGLHAPKAGGLGSIPGQETGSCKMQLSFWMPGTAKYINIKKKRIAT